MKYKCSFCFHTWDEDKLGTDPLRPQCRTCPTCYDDVPCYPLDSKMWVDRQVLTPENGLSISIETKVDLTEKMKETILALGQGEVGHGASVKALERRELVAEGELTEEGRKIFNQLKGEQDAKDN